MKQIHIAPGSPNSKKVMMANHATGLNLPQTEVDLASGAQKSPAYIALNPNGKMPILELSDGASLWESNAIINRMAAEAGSDLWPRSDLRYDILRWQFWEACHWTPACGKFISRHLFGDASIDLEAAAQALHPLAGVLDGHLAGRDWLVGTGMTTADISVCAILCYKDACHYPLADYANIRRWFAAMAATPAWSAANPAPKAA